jgi:hypothetical protein
LVQNKGLKVRQTNVTAPSNQKQREKDTKMNFAIARTHAIGRKRLKVGYVVAAAALALALTAGVTIAFTRDGDSGPSGSASIAQSTAQERVEPSQAYIYVVGSQQEAIALEGAFNEVDVGTDVLYEVLVIDTPEAEASFLLTQKELNDLQLSGALQGVTLIDTR